MADQKISALPALGNLAIADELPVVDVSGSDTRKITAKNLIQQGVALIDSGSIPGVALGALPANLVTTTSIQSAAVTAVKLAANSVGSSALQSNSVGLSELAASSVDASILASNIDINSKIAALNITGSSIADNTLTNAKYSNSSISYAKLNLSDGDIPGAKINSGSITSTQLGSASVTAAKIASNSIVASALQSNIITNSHIAANTIEANSIAPNAIGSSELADASVDTNALQDASVTGSKIADASITPAKLSGSISTDFLADGAITAAKLGASSVTASALANSSVGTSALINSSVTDAKISAVNGSKIVAGSLPVSAIDTSDIGTGLSVTAGSLVIANSVTAGTATKISFSSQGLVTGGSSLLSSDLPVADVSNVGGVYIPANSGLSVTGTGALTLASSITATTVSGVSVNNRGIVTSIVALTSSDIPTSSSSVKGGVIAQAGGGLSVDSSGNLSTALSGVAAGTYQSVTVTSKGVVTAGQSLSASDIPDISAAKLTTGTIDSGRIGASSIDGTKLSNTSTAIFQSIAQSGYPTAQFNGQLLFDTVSEDAFIYDGNAWQAITTLTKGSLVFGGTYNANTSKMVSTTTAGIAAGLAVGSNLPTPSATTDGLYVVVDTAGTAQAPAPVVAFSPPDYILGVTNSSGSSWNEIDLSQTVAGQVASNITFTPYGQLSSTNVQDAIQELETEKLSTLGGEVTGQIVIGNTGSLAFEGATVDSHKLTLAVTDPQSSSKTLTLPDITGTLITTSDQNTVSSTMVDGSLVNANLAANCAISISKLEAITAAQMIIGDSSNLPVAVAISGDITIDNTGATSIGAAKIVNNMVSGSAAIDGSKITAASVSAAGVVQLVDSTSSTSTTQAPTANALKSAYDLANSGANLAGSALQQAGGSLTGDLIIDDEKSIKFREESGNGSNFIALKAAAALTADVTLTLPAVAPVTGQVLKAGSTATTLEWATDSSTDPTKMPLSGGTFTDDVTFTGDSSNGLWDKSQSSFVANLIGDVTGNVSGTSGGFTAGDASNLDSGTVGTARLGSGTASSSTFLRGDGSWQIIDITNLSADNLTSGTIPDARFPSTLPALDGSALTALDASNIASGTLPDARLPSTLPAVSGANLTTLNASNISSGTIAAARVATLNQNTTGNAATATALATARSINGVSFDGSADITVTAAADTLTGTELKSTVVTSSLTSVGTLGSLAVTNNATIGGNATITGSLTVGTDLTVNGTLTYLNSTDLEITDKNIIIGKVSTPTDTTADGGGISLLGSTTKTFNWVDSTDAWTSSEHIQVASGKTFIGDGSTLTALNASNIASGTIAAARVATLNQNTTGTAATVTGAAQSAITSLGTLTALGIGTAAAAGTTQLDVAGSIGGIRAKVTTNYGSYKIFDGLNSSGTSVFSVTHSGTVTGTLFSGSGASLSNVNATTLDSIDSGSFVRSDANDTVSGQIELTSGSEYPLRINNSNDGKFALEGSSNPYFYFKEGTTAKSYLQWVAAGGYLQIWNSEQSRGLKLGSTLTWNDGSERQILHQNNVGSGGALSGSSVYLQDLFCSNWVRFSGTDHGLYHSGSDNHFYSDDANFWCIAYNGTNGGLRIRDGHSGAARGYVYANDSNEVGFLTSAGNWGIKVDSNAAAYFYGGAYPYSNGNSSLGHSGLRWNDVYANTIYDSKGNVRNIPQNYKTSAYTLVASDAGKHIYYSGSAAAITVPTNTFSVGDAITIISANSSTDITIAQGSGVTIYNAADGSSGTRTLASKGMATLICVSGTNTFSISGAGLS